MVTEKGEIHRDKAMTSSMVCMYLVQHFELDRVDLVDKSLLVELDTDKLEGCLD